MNQEGNIDQNRKEEFFLAMFDFMRSFLGGTAGSIRELADIQATYPEEYEHFNEFDTNPEQMMELAEKLNPRLQGLLFKVMFKVNSLNKRMSNMTYLSVDEKRKLATDLDVFVDETQRMLDEVRAGIAE